MGNWANRACSADCRDHGVSETSDPAGCHNKRALPQFNNQGIYGDRLYGAYVTRGLHTEKTCALYQTLWLIPA